MSKEIATWKASFQHKGVDAKKVYTALQKLPDVTAEGFVDAAASPKHPAHKLFEWDDTTAAHQYRLEQARGIIRCLVTYKERIPTPVRVLHVVEKAPRGSGNVTRYGTIDEVMENREAYDNLLLSALRELQAFRRRYAALSELQLLMPVIDQEVERLQGVMSQ